MSGDWIEFARRGECAVRAYIAEAWCEAKAPEDIRESVKDDEVIAFVEPDGKQREPGQTMICTSLAAFAHSMQQMEPHRSWLGTGKNEDRDAILDLLAEVMNGATIQ
ncbi:MAG: hypothetical protein WCE38_14845 [Burkholderiales bacterium]